MPISAIAGSLPVEMVERSRRADSVADCAHAEPRIELALVRKHRPEHRCVVAVNRQALRLFPSGGRSERYGFR
jgi:hypothetical protein